MTEFNHPRRVYLVMETVTALAFALAFTLQGLYFVQTVGLSPPQLLLIGASLEFWALSALIGYQLCLQHPQRVASYVALGPRPFVTFDPRMLPGMWRLWFQYAVATPGLGPHFVGKVQQRLARYLFTAHTARPEQWTDAELEPFLAPLREPARARAVSALYRGFILREVAFIMSGWYRKKRLTTPTAVLHGNQDASIPAAFLGGYENYAPNMTLHIVDGAAHYLADERPETITAEALRLFAAHPVSA